MTAERWLPVDGAALYEVSNLGRVRSFKWGSARVLVAQTDSNGYLSVPLQIAGRRKWRRVHQLVALAFLGPYPEDKPQIRHLDGDKLNNDLSNLRYGTAAENVQDSVRHGQHHAAAKTHCKYGHPFDAENTGRTNRQRYCKTCMSAYQREWRATRRVSA